MVKRYSFNIFILCLVLFLVACSDNSSPDQGTAGDGDEILSVGYYVNSTLGDKSFFDSAQRGIERAGSELGYKTKTIEGGDNQADWASGLESMVSSGSYDVIVTGTSQMTEIVTDIANRYPDMKFIFFDDVVEAKNVYSMTYSQGEGSFLAGAFAALVTTSTELENANPEKIIGFVGGMDIPIINDFLSGYKQGAEYVDSEVQVIASYIGNFTDSPKAKELTLSQINAQKADIVYQVAASAGLGILEAASEKNVYSIGVDSNQNDIYPGSVLTSMLKQIDNTVFQALEKMKDGTLEFDKVENLGMEQEAVGLAEDELYEEHVPEAIRKQMEDIKAKLQSGEIVVKSDL